MCVFKHSGIQITLLDRLIKIKCPIIIAGTVGVLNCQQN